MDGMPSSKRLRLDASAPALDAPLSLSGSTSYGQAAASCSPSEESEPHTPPVRAANHPFASTGGVPQAPKAPSRKGRQFVYDSREHSPLACQVHLGDVQMIDEASSTSLLCPAAPKRSRAALRRGFDEGEEAPHMKQRQLRAAQRLSSRLAALNDPAISGPTSSAVAPPLGLNVSPMPLDEGFALQACLGGAQRTSSHHCSPHDPSVPMMVDEAPSSPHAATSGTKTASTSSAAMGRSISASGPPMLAGSPAQATVKNNHDGFPLLRIAASRTPLRTRAQLRAAAATASASASMISTLVSWRQDVTSDASLASSASQPLPNRSQSPDPFTYRPRSTSSSYSPCSSPRPQYRRQRGRNSPASSRCTPVGDYFGDWSGSSNSANGDAVC